MVSVKRRNKGLLIKTKALTHEVWLIILLALLFGYMELRINTLHCFLGDEEGFSMKHPHFDHKGN